MALIASAALSRLQTQVRGFLPDTAAVLRETSTPNGAGGTTKSWAAVASGIPCMVTSYQGRKGGAETAVNDRFDSILWWRLDLPVGTDVRATDRLQVGTRIFEILSVGAPESIQAALMVMCTESVG